MGILHILSHKELKKFSLDQEMSQENKDFFKNMVVLKCIYKKGKPTFAKAPEAILNPGEYMWDFNSFEKLILPSSQAFAILSLVNSAKILSNTNPFLSNIMIKNAEIYYNFTTTYLRNDDGLFVQAENKTKFLNDDLKIKISTDEPRLIDQIFMHEACLHLSDIASNKSIKTNLKLNADSNIYLSEARNILNYINENIEEISELNTKHLSQCISSLTRCCSVERDQQQLINLQHIVATLCAEIESRIKISGEVERGYNDYLTASTMTHIRTTSALIEGYLETGIVKFKEMAIRVFNFLEDLYDESICLFIKNDSNIFDYSIKDISEIIKTLFLLYNITDENKYAKMLSNFYYASIEKTDIVQSFSSEDKLFDLSKTSFPESIANTEACGKAPVFLKNFTLTFKKISSCTASKYFNSYYSLYSCYHFLYYLFPIVKPAKELQDTAINTEVESSNYIEKSLESVTLN